MRLANPQQPFDQLQPRLVERLHPSDGEAAWNDRIGRRIDIAA